MADARVPFTAVDIRHELETRPSRPPDYEAEDRALAVLAHELAENPQNMLQKLAETAVELCHADTAGISLLETHEGVEVFRWEALAGVFAAQRNNTMPRDASPCGVCVDENSRQLMYLADRCFPALLAEPRVVEALLLPFRYHGKPAGTVWVVMNQYERKFDREDERLMRTLAAFASAGWQLWQATALLKAEVEQRRRVEDHLRVAQAQLMNLSAMLLQADDRERQILARELHDDLSQNLVALGMQISAIAEASNESPEELSPRIRALGQKIGELADYAHDKSHQLHPAILEDLGLEAALRDECRTFAERNQIPVRFDAEEVPPSLSPEIALCLFRVAQESLRNIRQHAGAREVHVRLTRSDGDLAMFVEDFGKGFDVERMGRRGGLGLIRMEERLRLVDGNFQVRSRPGVGTEVEVRVPLGREV